MPYVAKPARMPTKIVLVVIAVAMEAVEVVLVAATLVVAFGANQLGKEFQYEDLPFFSVPAARHIALCG